MITLAPAVVKAADLTSFCAPFAVAPVFIRDDATLINDALAAAWLADGKAEVPAGELMGEWPLSDADADWLADQWAADAAIELGAMPW